MGALDVQIDAHELSDLCVGKGLQSSGGEVVPVAGGRYVKREHQGPDGVPCAAPGLGVQRRAIARGEVEQGEDGDEI